MSDATPQDATPQDEPNETRLSFERHARYINPAWIEVLDLLGYGRVFVRAEGTRMWDAEGRSYVDFLERYRDRFGISLNAGCLPQHSVQPAPADVKTRDRVRPAKHGDAGPGCYPGKWGAVQHAVDA